MLAAERREVLLARLKADGRLVAKDLSVELGISEDSLRRDLRELATAGLCVRVYGGAMPPTDAGVDHATRAGANVASKHRVGERAAQLIQPGSTVIIDGGRTSLALVASLPATLQATVVTHSPLVAASLLSHSGIDVVVIGGRVLKHSAVTCGAAAAESAGRISADVFFLAVSGVHPDAGLTTGDPDEAAMKRLLAQRSTTTYVLASRDKIGTAGRFSVLELRAVAGVVTDADLDDPMLTKLARNGVRLLHAPG